MPKLAQFRVKHDSSGSAPPGSGNSGDGDRVASILHVDMDAFFVSVELLERPELKGKPVVVGGQPDQRGVVSAASYEARRYGIQSAMPLRTAGKLCPHAIFLEVRHRLYEQWSDRIAAILGRYSPIVEMASIDEAYLDLAGTERMYGPPMAAAHRLRCEIWNTTGLPCSMGLGRTRLVAKVASEQAKPRGLVWVPCGSEQAFLAPLEVRRIPGIGKVTEAALVNLGIKTVGQLAAATHEHLDAHFGRWGAALERKARGEDSYEFLIDAEAKSISHNQTFGEDTVDARLLHATLSRLAQMATKRLRDSGLAARTIRLTIRYSDFETITRSHTLPQPTRLDADVIATIGRMFDQNWDQRRKIRLLGVALESLSEGARQLDLLDPGRKEKLERLARATDALRDRFGFSKVQLGGSLDRDEN
ncbi:MAG: DNA polymerase IV [Candidatus Acidiferrales bacterium]